MSTKGHRSASSELHVVVLGGAAMDWVAQVQVLPPRDGLALAHACTRHPGGSAANVSVGIARLGYRVGFAGTVGDDENGQLLLHAFEQEAVDTKAMIVEPGQATATCFIGLDALGDRIVFALPGASLIESPEDLDLAYVSLGRVLYIGPAYPEVASAAAVAARQAGALVLYAPSGAWGDDRLEGIRPILQVADLLLVSRTEAAALTGQTSPEEAIQRLGETGLPAVIETLGPQGALVRTEEGVTHVPAFSVTRVRDTTGAGDAFAAGLVAGFLQGMSWPASARLGSAVAALKIQHIGARRGLPARGEAMGLLTSTPLSALDGS